MRCGHIHPCRHLGGIVDEVKGGDIVIATRPSVRRAQAVNISPIELPAAAHFRHRFRAHEAAEKLGYPYHDGRVQSKGQLLRRDPPGADADRGRADRKMGGLEGCGRAHERWESAALMIVAQVLHVRCGAVLNVLWNADNDDAPAIPPDAAERGVKPPPLKPSASSSGRIAQRHEARSHHQTAADLGNDPVGRLFVRLALPTITAQIVNLLSNIVDRIYIGRIPLEGKLALTGMGVTFPVSSRSSRRFRRSWAWAVHRGPRSRSEQGSTTARNASSERVAAALWALAPRADSTVPAVSGAITDGFGSSADTLPYAMQYLILYVLGTVFVMTALGLNGFITAQGRSSVAMKPS